MQLKKEPWSPEEQLALTIRKYLMASYLYYELNLSVMSDESYDSLCKYLKDNWGDVEFELEYSAWARGENFGITVDGLEAGTGHHLKFSRYCKDSAKLWHTEVLSGC